MVTSAASPLLVLTTAPDIETAERLARGLVEERLAACVNLLPAATSYFIWQGTMNSVGECQLFIKTRGERLDALTEWLRSHHPYELPEIIAVPIVHGLPAYLDWLRDNTTP